MPINNHLGEIMINLQITEDELATMYYALVTEHNKLLAEKKGKTNKATQTHAQILERQYTRCLGALSTVQLAIEANYK